ncbi:hypothetical protein [Paenibacillus popilliae]|uniref:Transcriptional regulator n=1 Tax=Paenibacillus popilliae ATCC 14706 TaxID=1212764 RepID=M9M6X3_PAEPP|nr:hypothetical protein [Paenibacillus popilliae]GAC43373.1 transcriptional regulator [Paenibacillus popilliae ATCC 14706]
MDKQTKFHYMKRIDEKLSDLLFLAIEKCRVLQPSNFINIQQQVRFMHRFDMEPLWA